MLESLKRWILKMREGLRSHSQRFRGIDLNKIPTDDGSSSKSPPRSTYCSADGKFDSEMGVEISSNAVSGGVEVTRGDKGEDLSRRDGEVSGGFGANNGSALPLANMGSTGKGLSEARPLDVSRDAALVDISPVNAVSGVNTKDEATGKGQRGRKRKMVSNQVSNTEAFEKTSTKDKGNEMHGKHVHIIETVCALPVFNPISVKPGLTEFRPLEADKEAATVGARHLDATNGVEKSTASGKGQPGMKRKKVDCQISSVQSVEGLPIMEEVVTVARVEEDGVKHENLGRSHDADVGGDVTADPTGNTDECTPMPSKGRRGRKRKVLVGSGGNKDNVDAGGDTKRLALDDRPQIVGRVLRSRTREANAAAMKVCAEEKVDAEERVDAEKEVDAEERFDAEKKVDAEEKVDAEKKIDAEEKVDAEKKVDAEEKVDTEEKVDGDTNGEEELERSGSRNLDMEIEDSARPAMKRGRGRPPAVKRGRGRPPKLHGKMGNTKVTLRNKTKIVAHKEVTLPGGEVVKGKKLVKLHKRKVKSAVLRMHKVNDIDKNEVDLRPKEEKQLLKEQIVGILKEAGWIIEHRPRSGRDYHDAVYIDGQGRTHWSVTLAYKKLEQKIADGTADEKEISAFTPIPGDRLSKLFRITKEGKKSKKGLKPGGIKKGGPKVRPDKKSAGERIAVLKKKANKGSEGVHCEREKSMVVSCMRRPKSRREGSGRACGLSARESSDGLDEGKRTLLAWMIDLGTISLGDRVQYGNPERMVKAHEGKITREGICCECSGKIFTLADFEYHHTGCTLGQPLQNIWLGTGQSLLQCMLESWRKQEEIHHIGFNFVNLENDPADDTCNICADGGDLICCDGCPSTFHQSCLQIQNFPTGDWHCNYCSCKFCEMICWENSQGDKDLEPNHTGNNVSDPDYFGYVTCLFCEEKFHVSCALRKENARFNTEFFQFCGSGCQKLFENLQKLLGVKHELKNGFSWTILRRQDLSCTADPLKVESNSKLAIAFSVIDECFTPIIDERSNINLIRNVCYSCGSNLKRLNYTGFCTFILEKNDEVVSAATIRVHGNKLAEMPFIGTRSSYRRKGMARLLMTAIEMALSSLDVEMLVIPSVSELSETWTKNFGFVPLEESRRQEMKYMCLVLFPGNDILEKHLRKDPATDGKIAAAGTSSQPLKEDMDDDNSPTDDTCTADVGSGLHLTCNVSDPGRSETNGLVNSTFSKDEQHDDFGTSNVKVEMSRNVISGKNSSGQHLLCA